MSTWLDNTLSYVGLVRLKAAQSASSFNYNTTDAFGNPQFYADKPAWIALSKPEHFEKAARENPVVKAAINLLASSSSNGRKVAIDVNTGEEIPWTENKPGIQKAYELLALRPNPLQSAKEFYFQKTFYLKVFGNSYVKAVLPIGKDKKIDLLNIQALYNLPSQFISVKQTGKLYSQTTVEGIISDYALTDRNPVAHFDPNIILHFNEVNFSSDSPTIMGISKLEVLKKPISNIQLCFEAMNTILATRGTQIIISSGKKDGTGQVRLTPTEKGEMDAAYKKNYGLARGQKPFLLSELPLEVHNTALDSGKIGIYKEFSNNSILVGNEMGVPPELIKTHIEGATYENQIQSVRRLYQDTTIPMTSDEDDYWSFRLDTFKYGFQVKTKWDHIPALADAFKDKAIALGLNGRTAEAAYNNNVIWLNTYLSLIEQPSVDNGDVYKFQWEKTNKINQNGGEE